MKTIRIYHNPRCSKSRAALACLQTISEDNTVVKLDVIPYLTDSLNLAALEDIITAYNSSPADFIREKEPAFKDYLASQTLPKDTKANELSLAQICDAIVNYPVIMQRPIVVFNQQTIIARDAQQLSLIENKVKGHD